MLATFGIKNVTFSTGTDDEFLKVRVDQLDCEVSSGDRLVSRLQCC